MSEPTSPAPPEASEPAAGTSPEGAGVSTTHRIAVIPGDGIGPEVVAEAEKVLEAACVPAGIALEKKSFPLGAEHWLATGQTLPEETLEEIRDQDAILFGAVGAAPGDTRIPSGLIERDILLKLRFSLDHYVNLRPSELFPGTVSPLRDPGEVDFVVVREGTEGPYAGNGGVLRQGTDQEIATEVSLNTAHGVRRLVRFAFELANSRERKKLTLVHKHNVLVNAGHLYQRTVNAMAAEYPDVTVDYLHVDAVTIFMTTDPSRFDVLVTDNLFGDIITDLAGAITGGIGLAPCGNINADRTAPSMFEPVHGSAPDIAGQQKANPVATILAGAMMLEHLGHPEQAEQIRGAVRHDLEVNGVQARSTAKIGDAIVAALQA
ncbi:3-isopropylmalate dehydrogenase [Kocuria sp. JC486]|uniref:3-isopropylmalate dehydrogenase n=1 Tax=Kocuria soli TaxID=2485125 RepID=A0A3N3ZSN3_9MICC|nr:MULTISPECIES: 3-isopropylmalate dehydrogenase [Kocuria]NHU84593.1 3-isopropylmalate dehydrogenase [Kocuria sp. JC486]ROZ62979.1 3-isopropylmalate dehydrogenase [Kocuria soli]